MYACKKDHKAEQSGGYMDKIRYQSLLVGRRNSKQVELTDKEYYTIYTRKAKKQKRLHSVVNRWGNNDVKYVCWFIFYFRFKLES